ncbi:hypothetical protein X943_003605 [Babesia divergens]|uniref:Uncharacterized protein n=1 Tax=Babesia divergens TaxID=32595 RepID=A0AAD9GDL0_BABDI|nr:hypothetical protein X943_003605 [Babesia divergens]
MDVEVVKGTVDVVQQRPEGEHPRGASAGETSGNESGELPQVEHIAELVLVITSFGGAKKHFFQSNLARHLLDCKGVVYYLVDANRDFSTARDLKDRTLYDQWSAEGVLKCEYNNNRKTVIHPQLIIDGVSVGDARAIQDLEDDGDLDYIIARMLCPSCLSEKGQDMEHCPHCYAQYRTLIPPEYKEGVDIQRFYQGMAYNEDETEE